MTRAAGGPAVTRRARAPRLPWTVWRLAAGFGLATTAETFVLFALLWLAEPQGWSSTVTGLLVVSLRAPALLGGTLCGRLVDRYGPARLALLDTSVRAASLAALAAVGAVAGFPLALVAALGALNGTISPTSYAAVRAAVPRFVTGAALARANAAVALGDQLTLLLGPVLAAAVLSLVGTPAAFGVPAAMLVVAGQLLNVRPPARPVPVTGEPGAPHRGGPDGPGLRSGARAAVWALIGLSVAYYFCYGPFEPAIPLYTRHTLGSGEAVYGLLWFAMGVGSVLGVGLAPWLGRYRPGVVNALGAVLWGLVTAPLALVHDPAAAIVIFGISGVIWGPYTSVEATALHSVVPADRHGTVFGTQRALLVAAFPAGAAVGGLLLDHLPVTTVVAVVTLGCTACGLAALAVPSLRAIQPPAKKSPDAGNM